MFSFIPLFIQEAVATTAEAATTAVGEGEKATPQSGGSIWTMLIIIIAFFLLMMFMNKRQQNKQKKQIESIQKGDSVVTAGGIFGKVVAVEDTTFMISVDDGVKIRVAKNMVNPLPAAPEQK